MLTVLQLAEQPPIPEKRRRFSRRQTPPSVTAETVTVPGGAYIRLTAYTAGGQPDWYGIWRLAGGEAVRLLMPREVDPPAGSGIHRFAGADLCRQWMQQTLIFRLSEQVGRCWSVGIYDPGGAMPGLATALLPYAADLRVVTDSGRYAGAARQAQEHFGAMLRVGADRRRLHGVDWLAAPDGLQGLPLRGTCGTVSAVPCGTEDVIDGWLPREYNKWVSLTPKNIPPEQFLAGLYECSGMRELGALPEFVRCNGRYIQLSVISD